MHQPRIRVLLVDDHQVVREGLRALLGLQPDIDVVGEAAESEGALERAQALNPDVVVMDITLRGVSGLETTERLRALLPDTAVLVLSMHDDGPTVSHALRAGARGYVVKGRGVAQVCDAVRAVARGEVFLSPAVSEYVLHGYLGEALEPHPLTLREREVLQLVCEGLTSRQIGARLGLSPKTIENHRARLMEKLDVRTTAALVRYALEQGLVR